MKQFHWLSLVNYPKNKGEYFPGYSRKSFKNEEDVHLTDYLEVTGVIVAWNFENIRPILTSDTDHKGIGGGAKKC